MSDTIWRDDPPTEPGWYWVKQRQSGDQCTSWFNGRYWIFGGPHPTEFFRKHYQFGPRVPDPETCARIERGE